MAASTEPASKDSPPPAPSPDPGVPGERPGLVDVWARFKRHKVFQWTLGYAAAAFALLQGTDIVASAFDWPHVTLRVLTTLLVLGLPAVALLAWYHGHKGQQHVSRVEVSILAVLVIASALLVWRVVHTAADEARPALPAAAANKPASASHPAAPSASIAVMPFANLTGDTEQKYFGDGMAAELIDSLAHVSGLKVSARTSSFAYKGRDTDIRRIAQDLGVAKILEGSVRAAGKRIRVTAQLVDAQTGFQLWSESYDRDIADIFTVQADLARAIVQALRGAMKDGGGAAPAIGGPPTRDVEAYQMYLQSKAVFANADEPSFRKALTLLDQALERDPKFALAFADRAGVRTSFLSFGYPMPNALADAERDARTALSITPNLASALAALASIDVVRGNWLEAETHYRAAITSDPSDPETHANYAFGVLAYVGRLREARKELLLAYRLAPANPYVCSTLAFVSSNSGEDADAIHYAELAVALGENDYTLKRARAVAAAHAGQFAEVNALRTARLPAVIRKAGGAEALELGNASLANPSLKPAARRAFLDMLSRLDSSTVPAIVEWVLTGQFVSYGELDLAYARANAAVDKSLQAVIVGGTGWDWIWDPMMRPFRTDPRFADLAARLKLDEYWAQSAPPDECTLQGGRVRCR